MNSFRPWQNNSSSPIAMNYNIIFYIWTCTWLFLYIHICILYIRTYVLYIVHFWHHVHKQTHWLVLESDVNNIYVFARAQKQVLMNLDIHIFLIKLLFQKTSSINIFLRRMMKKVQRRNNSKLGLRKIEKKTASEGYKYLYKFFCS